MVVSLVPGTRLSRSPSRDEVLYRVSEVSRAFPELDGKKVRVDLLAGRSPMGVAYPRDRPPKVAFHQRLLRSSDLPGVVAHELTHLIQRPDGPCPNGERACDLFALARCGDRFRGPPSYLNLPPGTRANWRFWAPLATALARRAFRERAEGRHRYIVWWEETFAGAVARARAG